MCVLSPRIDVHILPLLQIRKPWRGCRPFHLVRRSVGKRQLTPDDLRSVAPCCGTSANIGPAFIPNGDWVCAKRDSSRHLELILSGRSCCEQEIWSGSLSHKGKGHPATGRPSLQGRIVLTEARPSKLSEQILGTGGGSVKQFLSLKLLSFQ